MHVLILSDAETGNVLAVCRTFLGVVTAVVRERGQMGTVEGRLLNVDEMAEEILAGDLQIDIPDGGAPLIVTRFPLGQ